MSPSGPFTWGNAGWTSPDVAQWLCMLAPTLAPTNAAQEPGFCLLNRKSSYAAEIKVLRFPVPEPMKIADALDSRQTYTNRAAIRSTCHALRSARHSPVRQGHLRGRMSPDVASRAVWLHRSCLHVAGCGLVPAVVGSLFALLQPLPGDTLTWPRSEASLADRQRLRLRCLPATAAGGAGRCRACGLRAVQLARRADADGRRGPCRLDGRPRLGRCRLLGGSC
jgi:hypothetical protein